MIIDVMPVPVSKSSVTSAAFESSTAEAPGRADELQRRIIDEHACDHPLSTRVIGFACGRLRREGDNMRLVSIWGEARDEASALALANKMLTKHRCPTVSFVGGQRIPHLLLARMLFSGDRCRLAETTFLRRHVDLADVASCGRAFALPTREEALAAVGVSLRPDKLSRAGIAAADQLRDEDALLRELSLRIEELAVLYARLCFQPRATVIGATSGTISVMDRNWMDRVAAGW